MSKTLVKKYNIVEVTVVKGNNLVAKDLGGTSDPFVKVFDPKQHNVLTKVAKKTLNPEWNDFFDFTYIKLPEFLHFNVYDYDKSSKNDLIGTARIKLKCLKKGALYKKELILRGVPKGTIHVEIKVLQANRIQQLEKRPLGLLRLTILEGAEIKKSDLIGKGDPYVTVLFGHQAYKTQILKGDKPIWKTECRVWVHEHTKNHKLSIGLWDSDKKKDDQLGHKYQDISTLIEDQEKKEFWIDIPQEHHTLDSHLTGAKHGGKLEDKSEGSKKKKLKKEKKKSEEGEPKIVGKLKVRTQYLPQGDLDKMFWNCFLEHFDTDNNGSLDKLELTALLEAFGTTLTDEEIDKIFDESDVDNSGDLTFDEIIGCLKNTQGLTSLKYDPISNLSLEGMTQYEILGTIALNMEAAGNDIELLMDSYIPSGENDPEERIKSSRIQVFKRETGQIVDEKIPAYIKSSLRSMYRSKTSRKTIGTSKVKNLLKNLTIKQGKQKDDPKSKKHIKGFVKEHNINLEEVLLPLDKFNTYNEFFSRKLKPSSRPISEKENTSVATSPADCRMSAFNTVSESKELWIKGKNFTLQNLFGGEEQQELAKEFSGGAVVIARLSPQDYHRVHFGVCGTVKKIHPVIEGAYYTVSPLAINTEVDVYTENKRQVIEIETEEFGKVVCIFVGATCVGSICLEVEENDKFHKGDPFGYFKFGGSTQIVVFQKEQIAFDNDLLENTGKGIETLIKMGDRIGIAKSQNENLEEKEIKKEKKKKKSGEEEKKKKSKKKKSSSEKEKKTTKKKSSQKTDQDEKKKKKDTKKPKEDEKKKNKKGSKFSKLKNKIKKKKKESKK
ncbi:phosphatidylserine decarboxylase [Anaeramoeba flamelloides]|uniref:Phosphatidylserine decarboxylase n=1 Tax=Anaeramoeba flamelloides TaxID=1746091 RepID=A0ABQ8X6H9_9EUKA|nr:phosphatidylserine decarboxylase [Anaeramoeba flamelloides]